MFFMFKKPTFLKALCHTKEYLFNKDITNCFLIVYEMILTGKSVG